jgi:hypothetical protein
MNIKQRKAGKQCDVPSIQTWARDLWCGGWRGKRAVYVGQRSLAKSTLAMFQVEPINVDRTNQDLRFLSLR